MNIEEGLLDSAKLILAEHPALSGTAIAHINGKDSVIAWERQPISGLVFCEVLPIRDMPLDKQVLYTTIFLIFMSAMAIGLDVYKRQVFSHLCIMSITGYLACPVQNRKIQQAVDNHTVLFGFSYISPGL